MFFSEQRTLDDPFPRGKATPPLSFLLFPPLPPQFISRLPTPGLSFKNPPPRSGAQCRDHRFFRLGQDRAVPVPPLPNSSDTAFFGISFFRADKEDAPFPLPGSSTNSHSPFSFSPPEEFTLPKSFPNTSRLPAQHQEFFPPSFLFTRNSDISLFFLIFPPPITIELEKAFFQVVLCFSLPPSWTIRRNCTVLFFSLLGMVRWIPLSLVFFDSHGGGRPLFSPSDGKNALSKHLFSCRRC